MTDPTPRTLRDEIAKVISDAIEPNMDGDPFDVAADDLLACFDIRPHNEPADPARFAPMGDNHHNALACPYCSANLPPRVPEGMTAEKLRHIANMPVTAEWCSLTRRQLLAWATSLDTQEER